MQSSGKIKKPLHGPGGPLTDANFNPLLFTRAGAMAEAERQLKKWQAHGCKKVGIRDCGDYYRYSIC